MTIQPIASGIMRAQERVGLSERASTPVRAAYVRIWNVTRRIPRGCVSTYGAIAARAGFPGQPRLAGYALHNLPAGADIPWQRVINARGTISLPGSAGARQRALLEKEGVVFRETKVDLSVFGWPPTHSSRKRHRRPTAGPARGAD